MRELPYRSPWRIDMTLLFHGANNDSKIRIDFLNNGSSTSLSFDKKMMAIIQQRALLFLNKHFLNVDLCPEQVRTVLPNNWAKFKSNYEKAMYKVDSPFTYLIGRRCLLLRPDGTKMMSDLKIMVEMKMTSSTRKLFTKKNYFVASSSPSFSSLSLLEKTAYSLTLGVSLLWAKPYSSIGLQ